MFNFKNLERSVCVLLSLALLLGCSESGTPSVNEGPAAVDQSEIPVGRLDGSVEPLRYSIELSIDPSKDRFSGVVSIDVSIRERRDAIWLHGKNLDVGEVYLIDSASDRINAVYSRATSPRSRPTSR